MITAITNVNQGNSKFALKQANTVAFTGNPIKLGTDLVELGGKAKIPNKTLPEVVGNFLRKLTGDKELPIVKNPLTANGEIIHPGPDGVGTIKIEVPDKEIPAKLDGKVDGQGNIYHRTGDGTIGPDDIDVDGPDIDDGGIIDHIVDFFTNLFEDL